MKGVSILPKRLLVLCICGLMFAFGNQVFAQGDTWEAKADMPTARHTAAGVFINGLFYAAGGASWGPNVDHDTLEVYDPDPDSPTHGWGTLAPMPAPRNNVAAAEINGQLYVVGGYQGGYLDRLEVYDPASNSWRTLAPMPLRRGCPAVAAFNGQLFVFGGDYGGIGQRNIFVYTPSADSENLGAWETLAQQTPVPIYHASTAVLGDKIYIVGVEGWSGVSDSSVLHVYDTATQTWSEVQMPCCIIEKPSVGVIGGTLYVAGGYDRVNTCYLSSTYEYDPMSNIWIQRASASIAYANAAFGVFDNKLYVAGGIVQGVGTYGGLNVYTPPSPENQPPVAVCKDIEIFSGETISFEDIDNGSYDPDTGDTITLSVDNVGPFPLGENWVNLTATDGSGESDICQAKVTVVEATASIITKTEELIHGIQDSGIQQGIKNSLIKKLENAKSSIEKGNINAAINKIRAFQNEIQAKMGKKISEELAEEWIAWAEDIIQELENLENR